MVAMVVNILTIALVLVGLFFFFTGTVGLLRFPDFYCRMHATGKCDTLGSLMVLSGLALYEGYHNSLLIAVKIIFISVFIFLANPTATHAIAKAALVCGVKPWTKENKS
ncbi:MAG: monovalent cation/H(+) antiporter subunit G [Candidatus Desulfofervidaceae bacterium]|nr:monovalent cation/H(+) antiporter subunit G [Candidatus Desulfofervidaceae bacterium]